jgi:hypothetical protein
MLVHDQTVSGCSASLTCPICISNVFETRGSGGGIMTIKILNSNHALQNKG